ncbi:hypothetical protein V8F20_000326 [Naviculisporaceae sp. PSN 640]
MAPAAGPRGGGPSRGGAPTRRRDGNRSSNGTLGGGISKRRTDRDGDVSMDAPASGSTDRRANRNSRGSRGSTRIARNVRTYVENNGVDDAPSKGRFNRQVLKIHGLKSSKAANNPDGGLRGLIEFIERKASKDKQVKIGKRAMDGDCVWINVSKDDAPAVLHLNGYSYAGATLAITETEDRVPSTDGAANSTETVKRSKEAAEIRSKLESVLASRLHQKEAVLDLSALGADPMLSQMGIFQSESTAMKAFAALLVVLSQTYKNPRDKEESVQSVSVANNQIDDVSVIYQLALELPGLKRLNLENNKLDSISKLSKWKGQFRYLEELYLGGNEVVNQENFVAEMLSWFPYLRNLNGAQVRAPQQIEQYLKSRCGTPLDAATMINVRGAPQLTESFVLDLIAGYDGDRAAFAERYYDEESEFSLTTPSAPRPSHAWTVYAKHSRNLEKAHRTNRPAITRRLHVGAKNIADFWKHLPPTQHYAPQSGRWIIDSHLLPNVYDPNFPGGPGAPGMILTVSSEFEEADVSQNLFGTRGFSRTFILGPRKVGAAVPAGPAPPPEFRVISDQLALHSWKPRDPPAPAVAPIVAPVMAPALSPADSAALAGLRPEQVELVMKLSQQTGMTLEYSLLCLSGAPNWNYDAAIAAFAEQKASLPPTAFINQAA